MLAEEVEQRRKDDLGRRGGRRIVFVPDTRVQVPLNLPLGLLERREQASQQVRGRLV